MMDSSDESSNSSISEDSDPIIGWRKSNRDTSYDYRKPFALDAKTLLAVRTLCKHVDEDDFCIMIATLVMALSLLLDKATEEHLKNDGLPIMRCMETDDGSISSNDSNASNRDEESSIQSNTSAELSSDSMSFDSVHDSNTTSSSSSSSKEKKDKNCTSSLSSNSESDTDDYDERNAASSPDCNSDSPDPFFDSFQKSSPFVLPLDRAKEALRRKLEKCNPIDSLQKKIDTKLHECSDLPFLRYQTGAKEALLSSMSMFTEESIDALIDDDDVGDYEELVTMSACLLGCSILDLDMFCTTIVDLTAIRASEWDNVELTTKSAKKNRTIECFSDSQANSNTRFSKDDLRELLFTLFGTQPALTYTFCNNKFTYEETLLIALDYMANGVKFSKLVDTYGGDWTRYTYPVNFFARYVYHKYYHRLSGKSMRYWASSVPEFRNALWLKVCFTENGCQDIRVPFNRFRPFGWIDAMQHTMCRPGGGPQNEADDRREDENRIQRAFFTSYGKMHGMKTQALYLPNGMIGSVYFASVSHNDKGVVNLSGIEEELKTALAGYMLEDGMTYPALYGDEIYEPSEVMVKANGQRDEFYLRLTSTWGDVEHVFGLTSNLWKRLRVKHTWRIMKQKHFIRAHLFSIFFMTNLYTCIHGNKTATKYGFNTIPLSEYLDVDVNDAYDGEDQDEFMADFVVYN